MYGHYVATVFFQFSNKIYFKICIDVSVVMENHIPINLPFRIFMVKLVSDFPQPAFI